MSKTVYVYGLIDPRDGKFFYVGSTQDMNTRMYRHRMAGYSASKGMMHRLAEIRECGKSLKFETLEECSDLSRDEIEAKWIEQLREEGYRLLNQRKPIFRIQRRY